MLITPTTQVGWRLIRKVQKWAELEEEVVRLQKDMESWGMNHDTRGMNHDSTWECPTTFRLEGGVGTLAGC